jgi:hypothetical protein
MDRVDAYRRKIISKPVGFLIATSLLAFAAKKFNLRRMLANPLKDES